MQCPNCGDPNLNPTTGGSNCNQCGWSDKPRAASSSAVAPAAAPAGTDADLELLVLEAIERVAGEIGRIDGLLHVIHARLDALEKQPTADADNTEKIEIDADPRASE